MNKQPTNQPPEGREDLKGIIKHFISDCLFERHPSVENITEGIMHIISAAPPATVIQPDNILRDLKTLRNYFGEHDKTMEEHRLYAIADKLLKSLTTTPPPQPLGWYDHLNLLKETINNQHALIISAEQRGYEKAKEEFTQPLGIEGEIKSFISDALFQQNPSVASISEGILNIIKAAYAANTSTQKSVGQILKEAIELHELNPVVATPQASTSEEEKECNCTYMTTGEHAHFCPKYKSDNL